MTLLTAEAILNKANDIRVERVEIPEWGGHIFVKEMTVRERDALDDETYRADVRGTVERNMDNYRARYVVRTVCDENGVLIFKPKDAEKLGQVGSEVITKIFNAARRLSGGDISLDDLAKNLKGTDEGASSSS